MRFYKTNTGYKFDRLIFYIYFSVVVIAFFAVLYNNNFNVSPYFYFECKLDVCDNPLMAESFKCQNELLILWSIPIYKDDDCMRNCKEGWCTQPLLTKGVYGKKAPEFILWLPMIALGLFIISMVVNHFIHNKGKKFDIQLRITKNKGFSMRQIIDEGNKDNKQDGERREGS